MNISEFKRQKPTELMSALINAKKTAIRLLSDTSISEDNKLLINSILNNVIILKQTLKTGVVQNIVQTWDELWMRMVYQLSFKSKDPSSKIAAILVGDDNQPIKVGYNGFPPHVKDDPTRLENREVKYSLVVHAEENALLAAARKGVAVQNSILYTQATPCTNCSKSIITAGIKTVVVHKQFEEHWCKLNQDRWPHSTERDILYSESGTQIRTLDMSLNIETFMCGQRVVV